MPNDVMPEKVKHAAQSLSRLLRQHTPTEGLVGDVESDIILASVVADRIRADWDRFLMQLKAGMDAEAVRTTGAAFSITAETWSEVAQSLQDRAARVAQERGEPIEGVLELMDETVRMGEIGGAARGVVDSVNEACKGPLDPAMLAQSEDDFASGRSQKGKGVIARFRSRKSP